LNEASASPIMPAMWNLVTRSTLAACALMLVVGCEEEAKQAAPAPARAKAGEKCAKDGDCADGLACNEEKTCEKADAVAGRKKCAAAPECKKVGKCSWKDGKCVVGKTADCKGSDECAARGLCTFEFGACAAHDDNDCKNAIMCTDFGECTARGGKCVKKE
jgi:hypothetical protein